MEKKAFLFAFLVAGCGVTERVEIIREMVGCTSDAMCADRDEMTTEFCEIDSGICVRERVVTAVCETFADCDDGDMTSVDSCDADGVCNHTRDVTAPFDPASPERQDAVALCEMSLACNPGEGPSAYMAFTRCFGDRDPWQERGYMLMIAMPLLDGPNMIHFRPQMRVGDPTDLFRLSVRVAYDDPPILVRDLTGAQIQEEGFTIEVSPPDPAWEGGYVFVTFDFVEDMPHSRALQWALPEGGVINETTGDNYVRCMEVGPFQSVPRHGFLRLTESALTGEPLCTGTARVDPWVEGATHPDGLFRTESDSRLYYAMAIVSPPTLYRFETLREFIDWWQRFDTSQWHPNTICANAMVFPDASLARALEEFRVETVGARPGTPVSWFDYTTGERRYGFADRHWTILDVGTDERMASRSGTVCSWYPSIPSVGGSFADCFVDLSGRESSYTLVPTDPMTVDSTALTSQWGWLVLYNHDP